MVGTGDLITSVFLFLVFASADKRLRTKSQKSKGATALSK